MATCTSQLGWIPEMKFDVYAYHGDFCGNETLVFHGTYRAESIEEVQKVFPPGFVCGWKVFESTLEVKDLPTQVQEVPREPR